MSEFAEFLAGMAKAGRLEVQRVEPPAEENIDPEAVVMRLKEAWARFSEADIGPRFAVGDLVTPVKDSPYVAAGQPHIVIATRRADYDFTSCNTVSDSRHGIRLDVRLLSIDDGTLRTHWCESAFFVPWTLDKG